MSASQSEAVLLTQLQSKILTKLSENSLTSSRLAYRANLILELAKDNSSNSQVAKRLGISHSTARMWRERWISSRGELLAVEEAGSSEAILESRIMAILARRSPANKNKLATTGSTKVTHRHSKDYSSDRAVSAQTSMAASTSLSASHEEELIALRNQVEELKEENNDLNLMLETMTEHSDLVSDELHQEKEDLEFMLEMTTEHSDTVSEELQEKAEAALRESERRLRLIVQATPVPVIIICLADQEIQYANHMAGPLVGLNDDEIVEHRLTEYFQDEEIWKQLVAQLDATDAVDEYDMEMLKVDGTKIWVTVSMRPLEFNEKPSVLAAFHDITERKIGELRLQSQVEKLRLELDEARHNSTVAEQSGTAFFTNLDAIEFKHTGTRLVAIHSFRGGTGKSLITANIAALLAASGKRVGIVDTSLLSPGIHIILDGDGSRFTNTINDLLWENCTPDEVAYDVTDRVGNILQGKLFLIPSSMNPGQMAQVLSEGYEADALTHNLGEIAEMLNLDLLLIDTHPGLNEEALLAMGAAHATVIVMRPEQQDYEGTAVAVQIARKLQVPNLSIVLNQVPPSFEPSSVKARAEQAFGSPVSAVLPYATELSTHNGSGLFAIQRPDHPLTMNLHQIATTLLGGADSQLIQSDSKAEVLG